MALIGQIRKNSWILIVAIALGLGGFLLMDMVNANRGPGDGSSQLVVGRVNGEKIRRTDFEREYGLRFSGSSAPVYQNRNALWQWYTENTVLTGEADAIGLGVGATEITDLEFGDNPSPVIRRNFPNQQQPGAINREVLDYYKQHITNNTIQDEIDAGRMTPEILDFWPMQRRMIVKERLQAKLQAIVAKAMYTPTWMAEMGYKEQYETYDFVYAKVGYDLISNEEVSLGDSDLSDYLKKNAARFNRKQEQRVLDYVVFDVIPTAADSAEIRTKLAGLVEEFATTDSDSNFVLRNDGIITPAFSSKDELSTGIADTVMSMPVGSVYGPYIESGEYRVLKVLDRAVMADSADSRHILLSATTPDQFTEANNRADSIINVLRAGTTPFDSLVVKFSQDPGSVSNGGKYENITPNQFVPEYNEVLFITGQIGQLYKVRTSFGVHIIEVLKRSASTTQRAQVAYLRDAIVPSKQTQDDFFQQASKFIAENRDMAAVKAAVEKDGKLRVVATETFDNTAYTLGALGFSNQTKDAICWAFSADEGDVSPEVYSFADAQRFYDNKYVVIGLNKVLPAGTPKVEDIRDRLEAELLAERKTAIVNQHIAGGGLQAIASKYGVTLDTLTNGAFDRPNMQGLGNELRVAGMAAKLQQGQTSPAIQGEGGVYVIQLTRKAVPGVATNLPQIRQRITRSAQGAVASYFLSSLRDAAAVEDDRSSFECN